MIEGKSADEAKALKKREERRRQMKNWAESHVFNYFGIHVGINLKVAPDITPEPKKFTAFASLSHPSFERESTNRYFSLRRI